MIDAVSGFAPMEWQSMVGPQLVYRPGGKDLSTTDVAAMNDIIFRLLDEYSEGRMTPEKITPRHVTMIKNEYSYNHPSQMSKFNI
jgi:hypothetical protein